MTLEKILYTYYIVYDQSSVRILSDKTVLVKPVLCISCRSVAGDHNPTSQQKCL